MVAQLQELFLNTESDMHHGYLLSSEGAVYESVLVFRKARNLRTTLPHNLSPKPSCANSVKEVVDSIEGTR